MTKARALALARKLMPKQPGVCYPYAHESGGQCVLGAKRLPTTGSGPPEDIVLGYGPSWEDAMRMAEEVP